MVVVFVCALAAWSIGQQKSLELDEISSIESNIKSRQMMADKLKEEDAARKDKESKIFLTDQETYQLAAARQLIARRAFSWDKMASDIEENVPKNTKIVSVKVNNIQFGPEGPVISLDIAALGKEAAQLTEMMENLEKSKGLFTVGDVSQALVNDNGQVPFNLTVRYRPSGGDQ